MPINKRHLVVINLTHSFIISMVCVSTTLIPQGSFPEYDSYPWCVHLVDDRCRHRIKPFSPQTPRHQTTPLSLAHQNLKNSQNKMSTHSYTGFGKSL